MSQCIIFWLESSKTVDTLCLNTARVTFKLVVLAYQSKGLDFESQQEVLKEKAIKSCYLHWDSNSWCLGTAAVPHWDPGRSHCGQIKTSYSAWYNMGRKLYRCSVMNGVREVIKIWVIYLTMFFYHEAILWWISWLSVWSGHDGSKIAFVLEEFFFPWCCLYEFSFCQNVPKFQEKFCWTEAEK